MNETTQNFDKQLNSALMECVAHFKQLPTIDVSPGAQNEKIGNTLKGIISKIKSQSSQEDTYQEWNSKEFVDGNWRFGIVLRRSKMPHQKECYWGDFQISWGQEEDLFLVFDDDGHLEHSDCSNLSFSKPVEGQPSGDAQANEQIIPIKKLLETTDQGQKGDEYWACVCDGEIQVVHFMIPKRK